MLKNANRKRTDINLPAVKGEIKRLLALQDSILLEAPNCLRGITTRDRDMEPKKWLNEQDMLLVDDSPCV
jgi:hypothetical protein